MSLHSVNFPHVIRFLQRNIVRCSDPSEYSEEDLVARTMYDLQNPIDIEGTLGEIERLFSDFSDLELTQFVKEYFHEIGDSKGRDVLKSIQKNLVQTAYDLALYAQEQEAWNSSGATPKTSWIRRIFRSFRNR